jgi:hypothetical protein
MSTDDQLTDLRRRVEILENSHAAIFEKLDDIREAIGQLVTQSALHSRNQCPDPGACLRLAPRIETLEQWRTQIEAWRNQLVGVGIAAKAGWVLLGGSITAGLTWLVSHWRQ